MKILYINALYSPYVQGGAEISLKVLVEGMRDAGYEVVVLSLKPEGELTTEEIDGVKVYRAALQNDYWPFSKNKPGKLKRMAWHLKDQYNVAMRDVVSSVLTLERPNIVSCHNLVGWSMSVWDAIHQQQIPIIQVLHDLYLLCANSDMFKANTSCNNQCFSCKLLRHRHQKHSQSVNAVVGISQFILDRFRSFHYFPNAKQQVIYNSRNIPEPPYPPSRKEGQPLRIGYLGTLAPKKGIDWLIGQFNKLPFKAHLIIAGKGEQSYENTLKDRAKNADISFIGYTDSVSFYPQIDVLAVPSLWQEPLGMVAIEALANHIPVIANRVGGLKETVRHGYNGLWCNDQDPDSLGDAIKKLYEDIPFYDQLVKQARLSVERILSKERMISEYSTILKSLVTN